jgi:hypothetical protein
MIGFGHGAKLNADSAKNKATASLLRAICRSTRVGDHDPSESLPSESLQSARFHLIINKKLASCVFRGTAEPDLNLCDALSRLRATA